MITKGLLHAKQLLRTPHGEGAGMLADHLLPPEGGLDIRLGINTVLNVHD